MKFICRRCDNPRTGPRYRVSSEENGTTLLDVTVCRHCYEQAVSLGLRARPVVGSKVLPLHGRRAAFAAPGPLR